MKILIAILISLSASVSINALAAVAGYIIVAKGEVKATDTQGAERPLKRRSKIFEGDTLVTGPDSSAQIRFVDKALLSLKAESQLSIETYQKAKAEAGGDEKVLMNLLAGGFRTITGQIGKGNKEAYKVTTPAASIGIRGTNYEIAQTGAEQFAMAVWSGGIQVENSVGKLDIGLGGSFQFLSVGKNIAPEGLMEMPAAFRRVAPPKPVAQDNTEESQESESGESSQTQTQDQTDTEETDDEPAADAALVNDSAANESEALEETSATESAQEEVAENVEEEQLGLDDEETPIAVPDNIVSTDTRLSDTDYGRLLYIPNMGMVVPTDNAETIRGLSLWNDDGTLTFTFSNDEVTTSNIDNNFESVTLDPTHAASLNYNDNVGTLDSVKWGYWDSSVQPIDRIQNTDTGLQTVSETIPVYFLSVVPENQNRLRGQFQYSSTGEHLGDINGTSIEQLNGSFFVDFNTGFISDGQMQFSNSNQSWDLTYDGTVRGSFAEMTNLQGNINSLCDLCINGQMNGIFAKGGGFAGGFNLQDTATNTARGLFLFKGDRR